MEAYEETFTVILQDISKIHNIGSTLPGVVEHLKKSIKYNVPAWNEFRGFLVPKIYCAATKQQNLDDVLTANLVGWCVQIHQSFEIMADDISDDSEYRNGKKCWHRKLETKSSAINDMILLEHCALQLLNFYLKDTPEKLSSIMSVMQNDTFLFYCGQSEDIMMSWKKNPSKFIYDAYVQRNKFKSGICLFSQPFHVGLALAGITRENSPELWNALEVIGMEIGLLVQVQDDYLDNREGCNGDDIRNGCCTWMFLKARELCDEKEKKMLVELYGNPDRVSVDAVLGLYKKLNLKDEFIKFEIETVRKIQSKINEIAASYVEIRNVLEDTLKGICGLAKGDWS